MTSPLRLPALRQPGTQVPIWDWVGNIRFIHPAQTRHATGQFAEELACKLLGGRAMVTDGRADICPDVKLSDSAYAEVKSVGEQRQGIVYEHIIDRSMRFVRRNKVSLHYVFVVHGVRAADTDDLFALRRAMAARIKHVIVVPFARVLTALTKRPLEIMNYRSKSAAGKPDEPMPGWRIPAAQLREWATGQPTFAFDLTVFGCPTGGFPVYRV